MKLLITGICGFVGSTLAKAIADAGTFTEIIGIDNFSRLGSDVNRRPLVDLGIRVIHGDIRASSDIESLPPVDWVIDAAANPSVLAGVDGRTSSRQLVEHNLAGTINVLEYCKQHNAGLILLSTSRVYSIPGLANLQMHSSGEAFAPAAEQNFPIGISAAGINEDYSTAPPVSLYGSTKVTSEHLAIEYGETFGFPVWVNRCGVMAGAGQFGKADQGIFAFWLHSWRENRSLKYIGFEGSGHQVRDCLHPRDLVSLIEKQVATERGTKPAVINVSGGSVSAMSLHQLSRWCSDRWKPQQVGADPVQRPFDLPWVVLDHSLATETWDWRPETSVESILTEIADFADSEPDWIRFSQ